MKRYGKYKPKKERDDWPLLAIFYSFNNSILTLASEVLWQAPNRWSSPTEEVPLIIQISELESRSIWVRITRLTKLRFISLVPSMGMLFASRFDGVVPINFYIRNGVQPRFRSPGSTNLGTSGHRRRTYQAKPRNDAMTPIGGESVQRQSRRWRG